jgi:hypothetical protein
MGFLAATGIGNFEPKLPDKCLQKEPEPDERFFDQGQSLFHFVDLILVHQLLDD